MEGMTDFRVTYDGRALASHQMDARDLAPALMAMADLLDASVKALHGDKAKAKVNVRGSFQTGSFNIDFVTAVDLIKAIRDIFAGENATAIANTLAILGALGFVYAKGRSSLASTLKWIRGRSVSQVTMTEEGRAVIKCDDEYLEVEQDVLILLRDRNVRRALDRVLAPLDQDGIEVFAVGINQDIDLIVLDSERMYFATPSGEDILLIEDVRTMAFSIVSLAFKEENKWRLSDGSSTISARILDQAFLAGVNTNDISFSKGDVLICEVKVTQWQTDSGAKTDYDVIKVLDHRRALTQIPLPGLDQE
ncbi:hypothetical protein ABE543_03285 [Stenotrophomonas sp. TWI169]|uniref:hypothetical protein n=1 Tax=Stenotrophomonas sp. TWI169 TaxID=3136773 RepID=UPI003208BED7